MTHLYATCSWAERERERERDVPRMAFSHNTISNVPLEHDVQICGAKNF